MHGSCLFASAVLIVVVVGCTAEPEPSRNSDRPALTRDTMPPPDLGREAAETESPSKNWRGPVLLGGAGSAQVPNAVSWSPGRLDVFAAALQPDVVFELAHWWYDGDWHGPQLLGGNLGGDPSAVSWGTGRLDVFGVDGSRDGDVVSHWWFEGSWEGPALLARAAPHGRMAAAPSAVSVGVGRLDVFSAQSSPGDPDIVSSSYAGSWSGPVGLPGRRDGSTFAPAVVSWGEGRLDVFATDASSGELVHWWFDGTWNGPLLLGGSLIADAPLSAISWKRGRLDVFGASGRGESLAVGVQLAHWWYDGEWHGPELLGGNIANNPSGPSAVSRGNGDLDVFAADADTGHLAHWWNDGAWHGPELLGGNPRSTPTAVSQAVGQLDVFAFDLDTYELAWWSLRPDS